MSILITICHLMRAFLNNSAHKYQSKSISWVAWPKTSCFHIFMCYLHFLLWDISDYIFCPIFIHWVNFFLLICECCLHILEINFLLIILQLSSFTLCLVFSLSLWWLLISRWSIWVSDVYHIPSLLKNFYNHFLQGRSIGKKVSKFLFFSQSLYFFFTFDA